LTSFDLTKKKKSQYLWFSWRILLPNENLQLDLEERRLEIGISEGGRSWLKKEAGLRGC